MDNFIRVVVKYADNDWACQCPHDICTGDAVSTTKYGPYRCLKCNREFMVACDGWVDLTGDGSHGSSEKEEAETS